MDFARNNNNDSNHERFEHVNSMVLPSYQRRMPNHNINSNQSRGNFFTPHHRNQVSMDMLLPPQAPQLYRRYYPQQRQSNPTLPHSSLSSMSTSSSSFSLSSPLRYIYQNHEDHQPLRSNRVVISAPSSPHPPVATAPATVPVAAPPKGDVSVLSAAQALLSMSPAAKPGEAVADPNSNDNSNIKKNTLVLAPPSVSTTTTPTTTRATVATISPFRSRYAMNNSTAQNSSSIMPQIVDVLPGLITPAESSEESLDDGLPTEFTLQNESIFAYPMDINRTSNVDIMRDQQQRREAAAKKESTKPQPMFYNGSTSLALDTDDEALSPIHCFMRKYCVEAFSAMPEDVANLRGGKNSTSIVVGQVGIRCMHCKNRPASQRQERAVCFPSSLKNIYHSIETWQRRHSIVCQDIPMWIKKEMMHLMHQSRSGAGGRRQYWEEAARKLGIVETPYGLRFARVPGEIVSDNTDNNIAAASASIFELNNNNHVNGLMASSQSQCSTSICDNNNSEPHFPVVQPEDDALVTSFLFLLLSQMETCTFTEQDRAGGRSKVKDCPVGYPGMQCKHCGGKAGFGRYFPTSLSALTSANSDRNIFNHLQKCRKCPQNIKQDLVVLQQQEQNCKNRRGSRKMFFARIWSRLHHNGDRDVVC